METATQIRVMVPDGWSEVSIGQYQEIASLTTDNPSSRFIEIISILIDEDPEVIRSMEIGSLGRVIDHLEWTNRIPDEAWYKPIINVDGVEYGFLPKLTGLTTGEWIDLEHYLTDVNENLHKIFAVLYRPLVTAFNDRDRIVEGYDPDSAERRANVFKEKAMVGDVYGALVFFSLIVRESMRTIADSLREATVQTEMKKILGANPDLRENRASGRRSWMRRTADAGCGIATSIFWPRETSQRWMKFLRRTLS